MRKRLSLAAVLAALTVTLVAPGPVAANDTQCVGLLTGTFDNIVVPPGALCSLNNSLVRGNVKVLELGRIGSINNDIRGNYQGDKSDVMVSFNDRIGGDFEAKETFGFVFVCNDRFTNGNIKVEKFNHRFIVIGDPGFFVIGFPGFPEGTVLCSANTLDKGGIFLQLNQTSEGTAVSGNTVSLGNIFAQENQGNGGPWRIRNNLVLQGDLQVFKTTGAAAKVVNGNTVGQNLQCKENAPPFVGGPNTAAHAEDQCF